MIDDTDLDFPIAQCTNTIPPWSIASFIKWAAFDTSPISYYWKSS